MSHLVFNLAVYLIDYYWERMHIEKLWTEILFSLTTFTAYNYTSPEYCRETCTSTHQSLLTLENLEIADSDKLLMQIFNLTSSELEQTAVYVDVKYDWKSKVQAYNV